MINKTKRIAALALAMIMALGLFSGCAGHDSADMAAAAPAADSSAADEISDSPEDENFAADEPSKPSATSGKALGFSEFDSAMVQFLMQNGFSEKSFIISPLSLRAAAALAAAGAEGETQIELLRALGFSDMEELLSWFGNVRETESAFSEWMEKTSPENVLKLAESVWHNSDNSGGFGEEYRRLVEERFGAAAFEAAGSELADMANKWVDEQTNGMIPKLIDKDCSDAAAILLNALYLRSAWLESFSESATDKGTFTDIRGGEKEMDLMHQTANFLYYEDEDTQLVILPMQGEICAAFVLGSTDGLAEKIAAAQRARVSVTLPKFETEFALDNGELIRFLQERGAERAFSDAAQFRTMTGGSDDWKIDDVIQKAKIKLDENGVEAAAATAVIMVKSTAVVTDQEIKIFTADRPFSFCLYSSHGEEPLPLFFGQYVG